MAYESPTNSSTFSLPLLDDDSSTSFRNNNTSNSSLSNSTISDFLYLNNNDVTNLSSTVSSLSLNNNNQSDISRSNFDYNTSNSFNTLNYNNASRPNHSYNPTQVAQPKSNNNLTFGLNSPIEDQNQSISSLLSNPSHSPQQITGINQQPALLSRLSLAPKGIPSPPVLAQQQQHLPLSVPQPQLQLQQQQNPSQQQYNAILKLSENMEKFMSEVDQRLTALEKITREILVSQKTQKDFIQQQYDQILSKLTELPEMKEKYGSPQTSSSPSVMTTTTNSSTKSYREREKEKEKEQELADAQLAAQLQSQLDQENRSAPAPPQSAQPIISQISATGEKEEKCPICDMRFPVSVLEKHCNDIHFSESRSSNQQIAQLPQTQSQDANWFSRLFTSGKTDNKPPEQVPQQPARTASSAQLPYQQQYVLAPGYIQNPQGQSQYLYRTVPAGQVAPTGYTPATQVYYDSQGNVYNPNAAR
eukprot:TRINITY_DN1813_c0_g1_i1.p1 TRINITY_DN1813_c0_g1~~TRINITY_DN1813_c0_g1_i1.p1  ORF type:complete len:474 (-),score=105.41 TRINITY_DN1813_c0_g1_i1:59-1480(-)